MMNNLNIVERLMDDRLEELRAEGMRSQMVARSREEQPHLQRFPDLRQAIHALSVLATRFGLLRNGRRAEPDPC